MKRFFGYAAAVMLAGCAGKGIEVGSVNGPVFDDAGIASWPSPSQCKSGDQLPIVGTWEGYMEKTNLPSRSDAVKLVISSANATQLCGTITMGTGTPPPVPTDPNSGALPGITDGGPVAGDLGGAHLIDGYPLTILNGRPSLPRVRFEANGAQFWKPWCELQTAYLRQGSANNWHCVPFDEQGSSSWSPATGCLLGDGDGGTPVDCAKVALCGSVCSCTATGCTVDGSGGGLQFDLRVSGDEMNGPGPGSDFHLTRVR